MLESVRDMTSSLTFMSLGPAILLAIDVKVPLLHPCHHPADEKAGTALSHTCPQGGSLENPISSDRCVAHINLAAGGE